jgi:hypothetical protein
MKNTKEDLFFKSETARIIFYLVKTDGRTRCEGVGITDELYYDKKKAKKWYAEVVKTIGTEHESYKEALKELQRLYDNIID